VGTRTRAPRKAGETSSAHSERRTRRVAVVRSSPGRESRGVHLFHGTALVGDNRQEADELLYLLSGFVRGLSATTVALKAPSNYRLRIELGSGTTGKRGFRHHSIHRDYRVECKNRGCISRIVLRKYMTARQPGQGPEDPIPLIRFTARTVTCRRAIRLISTTRAISENFRLNCPSVNWVQSPPT
jgi:hypothetical protein